MSIFKGRKAMLSLYGVRVIGETRPQTFKWYFEDPVADEDNGYARLTQEEVNQVVADDEFLHPFYGDEVLDFKELIKAWVYDRSGRVLRRITLQTYLELCESGL